MTRGSFHHIHRGYNPIDIGSNPIHRGYKFITLPYLQPVGAHAALAPHLPLRCFPSSTNSSGACAFGIQDDRWEMSGLVDALTPGNSDFFHA